MQDIDRRHFMIVAGRIVPIVVGVPMIVGCGGATEPVDTSDEMDDMLIVSVSSMNAGHTHRAGLPEADLGSSQQKSYDSSNSSGHNHTVTFTANDFETLRASGQVTIQSSSNSGHTHAFTFQT